MIRKVEAAFAGSSDAFDQVLSQEFSLGLLLTENAAASKNHDTLISTNEHQVHQEPELMRIGTRNVLLSPSLSDQPGWESASGSSRTAAVTEQCANVLKVKNNDDEEEDDERGEDSVDGEGSITPRFLSDLCEEEGSDLDVHQQALERSQRRSGSLG